jgi:MSHA biogenesis protein MshI
MQFLRRGDRSPGTVVLELSDASVRALRVSDELSRPEVRSAASLSGQPPRESLRRLHRDGWFRGGRIRVMLGARQRETAILPRPEVDDAELVDAMRWQVAEKLPYPPEEALLDVLTVDDREPPARQQVIVMAAHRPSLAALLQPVARLRGQKIECVDVADCAQRNLVEAACGSTISVACITERDGALLFTVSRGRDLVYSRVLDVAAEGRDGDLSVERLGIQVQRAIDTLERRSPDSAPVRMVIGPPSSDASPLRPVAEQCGLPVEVLDWTAGAEIEPAARADVEADPALMLLVGAALRRVPVEARHG